MNFRSRWKQCVAAIMLAGMTVSGLTAYAEEAQPGAATPETAAQPTVTATPETAAQDAPVVGMYSMQSAARSAADIPAVAMYAAADASPLNEDAAVNQETITDVDFTNLDDTNFNKFIKGKFLPGWTGWTDVSNQQGVLTGNYAYDLLTNRYIAIRPSPTSQGMNGGLTYTFSDNLTADNYSTVTITEKFTFDPEKVKDGQCGQFGLLYLVGDTETDKNSIAYTLCLPKNNWHNLAAHVGSQLTTLTTSNPLDFGTDRVHTIIYTINLQDNKFSVELDGNQIIANQTARTAVKNLKTLHIYQNDGGNSAVNFAAVSITATPAVKTYNVWLDGTYGMNQLISYKGHAGLTNYYQGAADKLVNVSEDANQITLPTDAEFAHPTMYSYTLNGWYDVTGKKFYKPGETVTVTQDTVFYANWVPVSYDFGGNSNRATVTDQPDTRDFITTKLFDYDELFNLQSAETDAPSINSTTHREYWRYKSGENYLGFSFLNWAYQESLQEYRTIGALNGQSTGGSIASNLVAAKNDPIIQALFTPTTASGRTYVGEGDYLYQYDSDPNSGTCGYYYYDSAKNGASYNQTEHRFTLYQNPEYVQKQRMSGSQNKWMPYEDNRIATAFLPFNDNDTGIYNEKDGSINYWFGMQSSIDFWLPNDSGTNGNFADTGKPMEFRFSGDDDVWVFVDDTLVLDLGGIHGKADGTINFSTGKVTTAGVESDLPQFTAGNHTLTIYYLERGSSESNCSIYFNIAPKYSLSIQKTDAADSSTLLPGAVFGVYTDAACTQPAQLWDSAADESANPNDSHNKFTTDTAGAANCYGLVAGNTYYVKELKAPDGYNASNDVYTIALDNGGNVTPVEGVLGADATGKKITLTVKNEKIKQPDKPENTATPTPAPGTTSTPTPSATPAPAMATPTVTQTPGSGTTTTVPGTAAAPTAQVTSAIPQTEDTSHPLLLCILCIAGAFGFGVLYAKLTLWRKQ